MWPALVLGKVWRRDLCEVDLEFLKKEVNAGEIGR